MMRWRWIWAGLALGACDDASSGASTAEMRSDAVVDATTDGSPDAASDAASDGAVDGAADMAMPDPCAPDGRGWLAVDIEGWFIEYTRAGDWRVTAPHHFGHLDTTELTSAPRCVDGVPTPSVAMHVGEPRVTNLFGAFRFDFQAVDETHPAADPVITTDTGLTFTWPDAEVALHFEPYPGRGLWIGLQSAQEDGRADGGRFAVQCRAAEHYYGLGTQVVGPDLRGRTYPLWTQEQGNGKPENGQPFPLANIPEAAYAPMGVWHSSLGWSAVIGHDAYTEIDLCDSVADRLQVRSHGAMPSFVLMPGATPKERLSAATAHVGRPMTPPDWVLAPWNDTVGGPARLAEMATQLRALDIPSSAIWTEDWIGGFDSPNGYRLSYAWQWDQDSYPDLPAQIDRLHADGFAFLAYFNSFVPETTRMWTEGQAGGFLIKDAEGEVISFLDPAFRNASLVDLYDPPAVQWLEAYLRTAAVDLKIDGWMADFSEWLPVTAVAPDGSTGWTNHNPYPLLWNQAQTRVMNAAHADDPRGQNDWAVFVRAGWASINGGSAGTAGVLWAGDQNTNWQRDDGFPSIIPIGIHAGLAGVAWFATDIAGYNSLMTTNTSKELFFRWSALGAFLPVMRTHHGGSHCDNWSFERDAETIAHYRRYARIHTLLYPYLRALGDEASVTGVPIMRHGFLVEAGDDVALHQAPDQYFLGDALLVAPVVEQGARARQVVFPRSQEAWWPLLGDAPDATSPVTAPPTEIPVFVRPGTILPLLGTVVDSFYGANAEGVTDLGDVADWWRLALYPSADGELFRIEWGATFAQGVAWVDVDWSTAMVDETPLPECGALIEASCRRASGATVFGPAQLTAGDAWLDVGPGRFDVSLGGDAFGDDARPTPLDAIDTLIADVRRICPIDEPPEE
ncbi:MAG: alpha-glucosidase [Bradymonadia bacterium]|jgi:alpha-glucosidase